LFDANTNQRISRIALHSYLKYAQICARAVRNSLKDDVRTAAQRRDANGLKVAKWENGKAGEQVCRYLNISLCLHPASTERNLCMSQIRAAGVELAAH
jgi:F-type H+-transporting ATPase subunit epsilon